MVGVVNPLPVAPPTDPPAVAAPTATRETSLEGALAAIEMHVAAALRVAAAVTKDLRSARDAGRVGHCRGLTEAIGRACSDADSLAREVETLRASWTFDAASYLRLGSFAAEVTAAASSAGIRIEPSGERLVAFPSIMRVHPDQGAVEIDGRRETGIRPTNIVAALTSSRKRASRFSAETFLAALESAYLRLAPGPADGRIVRLAQIWELFTLRPGSAGDYSLAEFGRDLNLLDESGLTVTRAGRRLIFAASSGGRDDSTLTGIDRNGRIHIYWGVAFS